MNGKPWDDPTSDPVADKAEQVREAERSSHEYRAPREVDPRSLRQIADRLTVEDARRFSDRIVVGGNSKVLFMRAEHAPTLRNFTRHAVDISDALAGVRRASGYCIPTRPNDRRTVHILGKAKHWYADLDGQLHLADGESPWT